jgi:porphobilinogen deaminase
MLNRGGTMVLKIGTRGSRLALTQTDLVIKELQLLDASIEVEIVIIKTKGDLIVDRSLDKIGDKGLFVDEIEEQLRQGNIDIAIHSMKDLPAQDTDEFIVLPVLKREDPRDVLVTRHKIHSIQELPSGSIIGTGSKRRKVQIQNLIPNVNVVPIRGNVETRIKKMFDQSMDGIILAAAGLNRLDIDSTNEFSVIPFDIEEMIPAPAQGVLACQVSKNNQKVVAMIEKLVHKPTLYSVIVERAFLTAVNGGCHLPLGAYLNYSETGGKFYYLYGNEDCDKVVKDSFEYESGMEKKICIDSLVEKAIQCASKAIMEVDG